MKLDNYLLNYFLQFYILAEILAEDLKELPVYKTTLSVKVSKPSYTFLFQSEGIEKKNMITQYSYIQDFNGHSIYNLGFGEYDEITEEINDSINSNNDDMYPVFNTVLHTIPDFFSRRPYDYLYIAGSDSDKNENFIKNCKETCTRKCEESKCKKSNRRMNVYCRFINNNFSEVMKEYNITGRNSDSESFSIYDKNQSYQEIILNKKHNTDKFVKQEDAVK